MKSLEKLVKRLHETKYLTFNNTNNFEQNSVHISFLENGKQFRQQLLRHYLNYSPDWCTSKNEEQQHNFVENSNSLAFLTDGTVSDYIKNINLTFQQIPKLIKRTAQSHQGAIIWNTAENVPLKLHINESNGIALLAEYYIAGLSGLEKFYNIQRERKIWWMKKSANPSRYFVDPIDLSKLTDNKDIIEKSQSISIRSRFTNAEDSTMEMESITMVPLKEFLNIKADFPVTLVRSVINLDAVTFGE